MLGFELEREQVVRQRSEGARLRVLLLVVGKQEVVKLLDEGCVLSEPLQLLFRNLGYHFSESFLVPRTLGWPGSNSGDRTPAGSSCIS